MIYILATLNYELISFALQLTSVLLTITIQKSISVIDPSFLLEIFSRFLGWDILFL